MTNRNTPVAVGELTPSHVLYTYGIGSVVDLPQICVMVSGIDEWPVADMPPIAEDRLLQAVRAELGGQVEYMRRPPISEEPEVYTPFATAAPVGIPVATFPRWMVCPACRTLADVGSGLFKLDAKHGQPDRVRYVHENCSKASKPTVLPARFMVACENGHLDDFPWIDFVHHGQPCLAPHLELLEYGPSGEARDLTVVCTNCNAERRMAQALGREGRNELPACSGARPHLRDHDPEGCDREHVRAIILGASNLWFPVVYGVIAIPSGMSKLDLLVESRWDVLQHVRTLETLTALFALGQLGDFAEFDLADVFAAIQRYQVRQQAGNKSDSQAKRPAAGERDSLKAPEWQALAGITTPQPTDDFKLRQVPVSAPYRDTIAKVVLVERLREVRAFVGFTRLDAPGELADLDLECVGEKLAPISRSAPRWVPASDMRGEGIFIQFDEQQVQRWLAKPAVLEWDAEFRDGHRKWRFARGIQEPDANYPGMRYVLLHTFAHALMRQFALECGYGQASVRERIYSREPDQVDGPMAGVLIYTSAPDSEGTLGGLVRLGETEELGRHIETALESAQLCSSDPTCAEHHPNETAMSLHGAACHACQFAPETSCERGNKYLDRAVLVNTLAQDGLAFFH
jgi:hypothetical protein